MAPPIMTPMAAATAVGLSLRRSEPSGRGSGRMDTPSRLIRRAQCRPLSSLRARPRRGGAGPEFRRSANGPGAGGRAFSQPNMASMWLIRKNRGRFNHAQGTPLTCKGFSSIVQYFIHSKSRFTCQVKLAAASVSWRHDCWGLWVTVGGVRIPAPRFGLTPRGCAGACLGGATPRPGTPRPPAALGARTTRPEEIAMRAAAALTFSAGAEPAQASRDDRRRFVAPSSA